MITPKILAFLFGETGSPFTRIGTVSLRLRFRVKCISAVFSPSNVAPLRFYHSSALYTIASSSGRFPSAVGPVTQAE